MPKVIGRCDNCSDKKCASGKIWCQTCIDHAVEDYRANNPDDKTRNGSIIGTGEKKIS